MTETPANTFLKDIRFWIIFFFIVRLYGITHPPLEVVHNIRQSDVIMIARNFFEGSKNIFFPTIDVAGEKSGIVGSEFPLLNYLIYLCSGIFGFENWYGRIINLIVTSFGIFCFYKTIRYYFNRNVAFYSAIILLVSMWFTYARKTMPDTFSASLCIIALYYALGFLEKGRWHYLLGYFVFALAGCLSKITAGILLSPLLFAILASRYSMLRKSVLLIPSGIILAATYWWYFIWVQHLNDTYEFQMFFMGWTFDEGLSMLSHRVPDVLKRFYDTPLKYTGFLLFTCGLVVIVRNKNWFALKIFVLLLVLFLAVIVKSGSYFITNEYYILIFIPAMAFVAGFGVDAFRKKWIVVVALIAVAGEGIGNRWHDFRIRQPYAEMVHLETIMDKVSTRNDRIAINGEGSGTPMLMAHRRGWISTNNMLESPDYLDYLKNNECKFILILKQEPWSDINLSFPVVYNSEFFKVYALD